MKRKTEIVIAGAIVAVVVGAAFMAYLDQDNIGPKTPGLKIVANCKNGQFDIPWKGEMFVPSVKAGYKPEAVIPIPPDCER